MKIQGKNICSKPTEKSHNEEPRSKFEASKLACRYGPGPPINIFWGFYSGDWFNYYFSHFGAKSSVISLYFPTKKPQKHILLP
jgi:hypothetical protein